MAEKDPKKELKEATDTVQQELAYIYDAITSITDKLVESFGEAAEIINGEMIPASEVMSKTFKRGLVADLKTAVKNTKDLVGMEVQATQGALKRSEIEKKRKQIETEKAKLLLQQKIAADQYGIISDENLNAAIKQADEQLLILNRIQKINDESVISKGLGAAVLQNAKGYLTNLDKSGIVAAMMNDEVSGLAKGMVIAEAATLALAKGAFTASDNVNNIQKATGISYKNAIKLQAEFGKISLDTGKAYINSVALNKSFGELVSSTGIVSDFGGDTLITMTTLTKQLGLGVKEASQLALLARLQGKNTEGVLEDTVDTVNALNKQNGIAINAKEVFNDISTASSSIVVSLGMSTTELAEAATQARSLGLSLEEVDKIADSLLNFETSIANELSFELLTGKQINLEKARELALNNDLAGLAKEIANNTEITEAFANGNRIAQQAAAEALGVSKDQIANMIKMEEYKNLLADDYISKYGEQSYLSMQSQSAQEKFADTMVKIQSIIGDMAIAFAPLLDALAWMAESTWAMYTTLGLIATLSLAKTISSLVMMGIQMGIIKRSSLQAAISSITMSQALTFGLTSVAIIAAIAGIAALVNSQQNKAQSVQDGIADSSRGPFTITDAYGKMAMTAKGDNLAVSPNINKGGGDDRMLSVLERIAGKNSNVYLDSSRVGSGLATSTSRL